jgi:hypothetical protein
MDRDLDQHEDDGTKACRGSGSHSKTSEDSTKTLALVPSPLYLTSTGNSDTDTSNRRDERVGGRNVSRVLGAPHDPDRGTSEGAGKGKHLNTGIVLEGSGGNDSVLDGFGSTSTDSDCTDHFEDSTENHSLAVRDRARRNRSSPRVGDIVLVGLVSSLSVRYASVLTSTVVVGVKQGKECADGKDVVVLSEPSHCYCLCCWLQVAMSSKEWWSAWSWDAEQSRGLSDQYIYTASSWRLGTRVRR